MSNDDDYTKYIFRVIRDPDIGSSEYILEQLRTHLSDKECDEEDILDISYSTYYFSTTKDRDEAFRLAEVCCTGEELYIYRGEEVFPPVIGETITDDMIQLMADFTPDSDSENDVEIIEGDIFEQKLDVIAHQCNCTSTTAKGIALDINIKFPFANIYSKRVGTDQPGKCILRTDGDIMIACLLAQYGPGKPTINDNAEQRLSWFCYALNDMAKQLGNKKISIGFPFNIGCGLAGGKWIDYLDAIKKFATHNGEYIVKIYKLTH